MLQSACGGTQGRRHFNCRVDCLNPGVPRWLQIRPQPELNHDSPSFFKLDPPIQPPPNKNNTKTTPETMCYVCVYDYCVFNSIFKLAKNNQTRSIVTSRSLNYL